MCTSNSLQNIGEGAGTIPVQSLTGSEASAGVWCLFLLPIGKPSMCGGVCDLIRLWPPQPSCKASRPISHPHTPSPFCSKRKGDLILELKFSPRELKLIWLCFQNTRQRPKTLMYWLLVSQDSPSKIIWTNMEGWILILFLKIFFFNGTQVKSVLNLLQCCFGFTCFGHFRPQACGILFQTRINLRPALEDEVLTTRPPGGPRSETVWPISSLLESWGTCYYDR